MTNFHNLIVHAFNKIDYDYKMIIIYFFTYVLTISIIIGVSEIAKLIFISKSENDQVITRI